jgi:hypothetical protein
VPRSKALFSLLAVPLIALLLIGCGGDDKDSSSDGGSSSGDSSSSSSGSSGSGGSSSSGDDRAVSLENCKEYTSFATTAASAMGAGSSGQFKFDKGAFDKMVKASPKEIRADMEVVVGALVSYFEVLEKAGLTGDPSKIDPAKLQAAQADLEKAAAKFEDKKVTEASERIEAFFEKNCS